MKHQSRIIAFLLTVSSIVLSKAAVAQDIEFRQWAYDYFIDGAALKLGVGTRQAGIRVVRLTDKAEGKIVQRDEESYFISYSTSPIYFSIDKAGLTFVFNVSGFNADQQEIARDVFSDIGSRARGQFYYIVPTVFYEWGDYLTGTYARIGLGVGAGVAKFSGNVILTNTPANDNVTLNQTRTSVTFASSLVLEGHWKNWGLTFRFAGPVYETDEYQFNVEDMSVNLGYQFIF